MEKALVDADIILDLLTQRQPFYTFAARLFSLADQKKVRLSVSSLTFSNLHYLLSKTHGNKISREILLKFKTLVKTLTIDEKIIELSLVSDFKDFEDAIQYYAAIENGIVTIITRNIKDYKSAIGVTILSAEDFLKTL